MRAERQSSTPQFTRFVEDPLGRTIALRERIRAGNAQSRREGRPRGRPRTAALKAGEVRRLKVERFSHSEIEWRLGIGRISVRRVLAAG
jgi:DNA invertase Pin-like site-specific DNA recombinase